MANPDLVYNIPKPAGWGARNPFIPNLILIVGLTISAGYQAVSMQSQLSSIDKAIIDIGPKVKQAQYEQAKLYSLAKAVLQLAPTNANAAQIAADYKFHSADNAPGSASTNAAPGNPAH